MLRKYYIDNLRWAIMLLLMLMHTCMCYNSCGLPYYLREPGIPLLDSIMFLLEPWRQGAFFLVSGMSMRYSLESHGVKHFAIGRITRILLPFAVAKLTLIPIQSYLGYVDATHFDGSFFEYMQIEYLRFFFTFYITQDAQLWFLRVLLVVTAAAGLFLLIFNRKDKLWELCGRADFSVLLLLTLPVALMGFTFRAGYYHFYGRYFIIFLLGYLLLSHDEACDELKKHWAELSIITSVLLVYLTIKLAGTNYYRISNPGDEFLWYACGWTGSLSCVGVFARFFDKTGPVAEYLSDASYHVYLVHQTILLLIVFFLKGVFLPKVFNYFFVFVFTTVFSLASYAIFRHIPIVRVMFGISPPKKSKADKA